MGGVGGLYAGTGVFSAVYGTARIERARTSRVTTRSSFVIMVNSERDSGAKGLFSVYGERYRGAILVRATTRLSLGGISITRSVNMATNTSAPTEVVGRMLSAVDRMGSNRAGFRPSFRRVLRRSLGGFGAGREMVNAILDVTPGRIRMSINEGRANFVPTSRLSGSPGTEPRSMIGINSIVRLLVVGAGSRRNAVVLSGHEMSTRGN